MPKVTCQIKVIAIPHVKLAQVYVSSIGSCFSTYNICPRLTPPKEKVFIAGTNLEAYANKYTFVWKKHSLKQDISKREIWDMIKQQALIYAMPEKRESHCP